MLKIKNIKKIYAENTDNAVEALKGISINFRKCEFVSILGQSGCGKTTLLNIIGGLDRYSSGDLIINGKSTKEYSDREWDTYRNHSIGFVFQSYNLIPHLTILENVALALTIGGLKYSERKERAKEALIKVGLKDKLNKKPNELSGGQMQRVSIARALVNEPDIILADEPTGALDSDTSVQVMDLLQEIAKEKLVIMVTHNPDLAYKYSNRIITMLDGVITNDTNPFEDESLIINDDKKLVRSKKYSSMNFLTAFKLSGKNLLSKKKRTFITSSAASIGIMGIAIIMSISNGMQNYIDNTMLDSASFNYVYISSTTTDLSLLGMENIQDGGGLEAYPENTTGVIPYEEKSFETKVQKLDESFINYLETQTSDLVIDISYTYSVALNILTQSEDGYINVNTTTWNESLNNVEYLSAYYSVLAKDENATSDLASEANEVSLVVDKYNRLSTTTLDALGISYDDELSEISYSELIGKEFRVVFNDGWYSETEINDTTLYIGANSNNYEQVYNDENGITVKITSVLRENEDAPASWLKTGINYSPKLTKLVLEENKDSAVCIAQVNNPTYNVTTGMDFTSGEYADIMASMGYSATYESALASLGYSQIPSSILIYPTNVENRIKVIEVLDSWNNVKSVEDKDAVIEYIDMASTITTMLNSVVDVVTYVLMAFSITSLIISSIMIAIIIYASVIERTKEIGVLRSLGARKKDVGRIFEAEAILIGLVSGFIAILATLGIDVLINLILDSVLGVTGIANLTATTAICLILLSAGLLLIASLIPARIASKKEPAVALRTE